MDKITPAQLEKWPFKLGASFRLVAKELLARGWSFSVFESNPEHRWGYFLATKDNRVELLASLKFEFTLRLFHHH